MKLGKCENRRENITDLEYMRVFRAMKVRRLVRVSLMRGPLQNLFARLRMSVL